MLSNMLITLGFEVQIPNKHRTLRILSSQKKVRNLSYSENKFHKNLSDHD